MKRFSFQTLTRLFSYLNNKLSYRSELSFNNSLLRSGRYSLTSYDYERLAGGLDSYWDHISSYIYNAAEAASDNPFFQNQFVVDHLASFDPPLGYSLLNYILKQAGGKKYLSLCQTPPWGSPFLLRKYPSHSSTTLSHISNMCEVEQKFQRSIDSFSSILDFGGGFGGLARCILLASSSCNVTIQDSPKMLEVQNIYLQNTIRDFSRINFSSSLSSLQGRKYGLFNASFSLSETPFDLRDQVLDYVRLNCRNIFIIFQNSFGAYDNYDYFSRFSSELDRQGWLPSIENYRPYSNRKDISVLHASSLNNP